MLIETYFREVEQTAAQCYLISDSRLVTDKRSLYIGFVEGTFTFIDDSVLHFMEFVNTEDGVNRYKYSYHYQGVDGNLIFRYDMAPHCPDVTTFPHHKHEGDGSTATSEAPALREILGEVECLIRPE